jgi:hypothetical protein
MQEKIPHQFFPVLADKQLPEPERNVIVITPQYRCLGYVDAEGRWHGIARDTIRDVVAWLPV